MSWLSPEETREPAADSGLLDEVPAGPRWEAAKGPGRRWRRWLFNGARPEPVPSQFGTVEPPEPGKLGVCCSGGGIRSAAFSLGALQVLQDKEELRRAAYLAAVSGGSYIAAAISMVARTGAENSDPALLEGEKAFAPGSPEEQYLRNRCSYLAPTLTDKIYLGWRIVLGLLVNVAFIALPLVGAAVLLSGLLYTWQVPDLAGQCGVERCAANTPAWFWIVPAAVLLASALCGAATLLFRWHRSRRERFFAIWSVRALVGAAVLALVLLGLPNLIDWLDHLGEGGHSVKPSTADTAASLGTWFAALLAGVIAQLGHLLTSKKATETMGFARKAVGKLSAGARLTLAYAAGAVFGPLLLLAIVALAVSASMAQAGRGGDIDLGLIAVGLGILVGFALLYRFVDLTTWSLHPYYKRRLSSAFALKRVTAGELSAEERDRVEALDPATVREYGGIAIERDFDDLVSLSATALDETKDREWPTLLVCAAANVSDPGATPPGRQVTSFTFSAHAVGGPLVGAIETEQMEQAFSGSRHRDLTLPAAVAMSGAAISPSMGKMTRRPLTFLMALANVRLGVWVPNPRWVAGLQDGGKEKRHYGKPRPWYLLCELLGRNRVDARYLYVSDGGHYENLGLVELLRRGCTEIYCFDASGVGEGQAEFGALGEAIALARSELGIEIEFEEDPKRLTPDPQTGIAESDIVEGTISYPDGPTGILIYARNTLTADAPWDALAHHAADPRFPHNSTVDQLYTDQKFEAYRVLGARAGGAAVAALTGR